VEDDVLKDTPKNELVNITSFNMLFRVLGVPFDEQAQTFKVGPRSFHVDMSEMLKDARKDFRVRTHRSGGKSENIAGRPPSDFDNTRNPITSMSYLKETL
jgi:hypothetical protein